MAFTVQNVVDLSRDWLNDDAKVRMSDAKGERFVNAGLQAMALIRPDLFTVQADITPVAAQFWQQLNVVDPNILALYDVISVKNGNAIFECELRTLLAVSPAAVYATAGVPLNWGRDPSDKTKQSGLRYWLSPPPVSGTHIIAQISLAPTYRTLGQSVLGADLLAMAEAYRMALAKLVQYCAETMDDEYVDMGRAEAGMKMFLAQVKAGEETKQIENLR